MNNTLNPEKFIDSIDISDWQIDTEDGWKDITHVHKTIKYKVWQIKTSDFSLKCADEHIVMNEYFEQIFVKDLRINDKIITKKGIQKITSIEVFENDEDNMYDVTIDSKTHTLFTNGILSHNTTVSVIYLLHYAIFQEHKTIVILANREKTAIEILRRLKFAYQEMPLWLQFGISEANGGWNKSQVGLENGIKIIAGSTASSAIRGEVGALVFLDEFAFVPENIADDFMSSVYPTLASGKNSRMIIVSTPNGLNQFYQIFMAAVRDENNFMPIQVNWDEVPGRNKKWKEEIMRDIGPQKWAQEFGCSLNTTKLKLLNKETNIIEERTIEEWHNILGIEQVV